MKSATTITTTHFGLFLVVLLLVKLQLCACQSSWSRQDEQLKYGQRKLPTKGDDGGKTSQEEDILPDNEENLDSEEVKSSNFPTETSRTNIRKTMDNMAREMRSKTMSKIFQGNDMQEPIEQMVSYGETGGGSSSSSSSSSHHDNDEGNIQIAVKSKRRYEFVPFHYDRDEMKTPRMIEIVSDTMPLRLHFKSQSAAIVVTQSHMSPPMKPVDEKVSMDEPYHLKQEIHRPILQTVKEFIHPYRNIVQTLRPVREDIRTIVPKDSDIGHNHMIGGGGGGSGSGGKTNDWSPVSGAKRSSASIRQPVRLSPSQQLQQNRYGSSARPITQLVEGVKASESRASRLQRRAHHSFLDKPSRLAGAHSYNKYNTGLDKSNMSPMQYGSSEPELIYLPMYAQNEHQLNHRHSLENDYADTESHISSYIDHLKNEEGTSDEPTVVPGSIGETLSRAKRHHPHHHNNNNNMVQCNEMGCEVSGSDAHSSSSSSSWADDAVDDDDYDRHYF